MPAARRQPRHFAPFGQGNRVFLHTATLLVMAMLVQHGSASEVVLADDFDSTINSTLWASTSGGEVGTACGADSGNAFFFNGAGIRQLVTERVDLTGYDNASISCMLRLGDGNSGSTCEKVKSANFVVLEYSVNVLVDVWILLHTFTDNSVYRGPTMEPFTAYLPLAARTSSVKFRWTQPVHGGEDKDNWGLDSIAITKFDNTLAPTDAPTLSPTASPTPEPTLSPSASPTAEPTLAPTASPTTPPPTGMPTPAPSGAPTPVPTSAQPTQAPTPSPTEEATPAPTPSPSAGPTPLIPLPPVPITLPPVPITLPPVAVTLPPVPVTLPPVSLPPVTLPPVTLPPVTLPPVPATLPPVPVTLPPVSLPPVTLPPVSLPPVPVTLPPVSLPPVPVTLPPVAVTLPPVSLPPVSLPPTPITLPPVSLPPVSLPPVSLPPVSLPPVSLPPVSLPPVSLPPVSLPPVSLPPVSLPPVSLPPVSLPPVSLPPVALPPVSLPPALAPTVQLVGLTVAGLPVVERLNPDVPLILTAAVTSISSALQGDVQYLWECVSGGLDLPALGVTVNLRDLTIAAHLLGYNANYTFRVSLSTARLGTFLAKTVGVVTSSLPSRAHGTCGSTPTSGASLSEFQLYCVGWSDLPIALPLTYGYSATLRTRDGIVTRRVVTFSSSPNASFVAPYRSTTGNVTITAAVRNKFGVTNTFSFEVTVSPPDLGGQDAASFAAGLVNGPMANAAAAGDVSQVAQFALGLDGLLADYRSSKQMHSLAATGTDHKARRFGRHFAIANTADSVRQGMFDNVITVNKVAPSTVDVNFTLVEAVGSITSEARELNKNVRAPAARFVTSKVQGAVEATREDLEGAVSTPNTFVKAAIPTLDKVIEATATAVSQAVDSERGAAVSDADVVAQEYDLFVDSASKLQLRQTSLSVATRAASIGDNLVVITGKEEAAKLSNASLNTQLNLASGSSRVNVSIPSSVLAGLSPSAVVNFVFATSKVNVRSQGTSDRILPNDVVGSALAGSTTPVDTSGSGSSPYATLSFFNTDSTNPTVRGTLLDVRDLPVSDPIRFLIPHTNVSSTQALSYLDYTVDPPRVVPEGNASAEVVVGDSYLMPFCRYWDASRERWAFDGCRVNAALSSSAFTLCECTHLTSFSIEFRDVKPGVTPLGQEDVDNLTVDNILKHPATFLAAVGAVLVYMFALPWAKRKDKEFYRKYDYLRRAVTLHSLNAADDPTFETSRDPGLMGTMPTGVSALPANARRKISTSYSEGDKMAAKRMAEMTAKIRRDAQLVAAKEADAMDQLRRLEKLYYGSAYSNEPLAPYDNGKLNKDNKNNNNKGKDEDDDDDMDDYVIADKEQQVNVEEKAQDPKSNGNGKARKGHIGNSLTDSIKLSKSLENIAQEMDELNTKLASMKAADIKKKKKRKKKRKKGSPQRARRNLLRVGVRVVVDRTIDGKTVPCAGVIEFYGNIHFAKGKRVGVVLDEPLGDTDGVLKGVRYFLCSAKRGVFVRPSAVIAEKDVDAVTPQIAGVRRTLSRLQRQRLRAEQALRGLQSSDHLTLSQAEAVYAEDADDEKSNGAASRERSPASPPSVGASSDDNEAPQSTPTKERLVRGSRTASKSGDDATPSGSVLEEDDGYQVTGNLPILNQLHPSSSGRDISDDNHTKAEESVNDEDADTDAPNTTNSTALDLTEEEFEELYWQAVTANNAQTQVPQDLPVFERTSTWRAGKSKLVVTFLETFRHKHLWLSVALRHPRDRVNSVERMSCILALVLGIMAFNAAFYANTDSVAADLALAILASILTMPVTIFMVAGFRGGSFNARVPSKHEYATKNFKYPGCCPRRGKAITWVFWFCWCVGSFMCALVYGLRFELKGATERTASGLFVDLVGTSLTNRWLLSCLFAYLQDILVNRPIYIFLRSYVVGVLCAKQCAS